MEFILEGEVPSKKNFWKIGRNRQGTAYIYNAEKVSRWTHDNFYLLKSLYKGERLTCPIKLSVVFYIRRDKDIDNMLGSLQDLLQKVIIDNDSQIVAIDAKKIKNLESQRVWFNIQKYENQ